MPKDDLFEQYLNDYQGDLKSVVGAYRMAHHHLTLSEIIADVNLSLYKKREAIMDHVDGEFTYTDFCKVAYRYAVNLTKWSAENYKIKREKQFRLNKSHSTEEGIKSSFDYVIEFEGVDDPDFEEIFGSDQAQYFLKYVREYSQLLSPMELHIISLLEIGKNQYEIADHLGITHQGVSIALIKLAKKLRSNIKFDYKEDGAPTNGLECAMAFFSHTSPYKSITQEDRVELLDYLLSNKGRYTVPEAASNFKKGKYTPNQIRKLSQNMGVFYCLKRPLVFGWPPENIERLIEMVRSGYTIRKIADAFHSPYPYLIRRKCKLLRSNGVIDVVPPMGAPLKHLTPRDKKILKLFNEGHSCKEVSSQLNVSVPFVAGKRRWFKSRHLLLNPS